MRTAKIRFNTVTIKFVTLLLTAMILLTALASCGNSTTLTAEELPDSTVSLIIADSIEEDGVYYVLAHAVDADGTQSKELYRLPLSSRFIGEFVDPSDDSGEPIFFAGPAKFHEEADFIGELPVTAQSFIFNDSGELILLSDALPEEE